MAKHDVIVTLTGESTGIQKAANSGSEALRGLSSAIQTVVERTQSSSTAVNNYQDGLGKFTSATTHAKAAVAQLNQEEAKRIAIENQLIATLTKEEVAVLRKNGVIGAEIKVVHEVSSAIDRYNKSVAAASASTSIFSSRMQGFRTETGQVVSVVQSARAAVAQLESEKKRAIQIEEMLVSALSDEQVAILRSAGLMTSLTVQTEANTNATAVNSQAHTNAEVSMQGAAAAVQGMGGAAGSSSFALLSFTQGIQDAGNFGMGAAQGIRAVNNNLQSFATAIMFSAEKVGGFKNAMKGMIGAMAGPAGLLLAFSVITASIEYFSNASQRASKRTRDLADAMAEVVSAASSMVTIDNLFTTYTVSQSQAAHATVFLSEKIRQLKEENNEFSRNIANGSEEDAAKFNENKLLIEQLESSFSTLIGVSKDYQTQQRAEQILRDAGLGSIIDEEKARIALEKVIEALLEKTKRLAIEAAGVAKTFDGIAKIAPTERAGISIVTDKAREVAEGGVVTSDGQMRKDFMPIDMDMLRELPDDVTVAANYAADGIAAVNQNFSEHLQGWLVSNAETIERTGQMLGSSLGSAGQAFSQLAQMGGEANESLFNTGKAFAIASAVVNTATAITKAYAVGGPLGIGMAAAMAVSGAAQIAVIAKTKFGDKSGSVSKPSGGAGSTRGVGAVSFGAFSGATSIASLPNGAGLGLTTGFQPVEREYRFEIRGRDLVSVLDMEGGARTRMGARN